MTGREDSGAAARPPQPASIAPTGAPEGAERVAARGPSPAAAAQVLAPTAGARPAPLARMLIAQTRAELLLTLRRGESVLVTLVIPCVLLVFFMSLPRAPLSEAASIDFLLSGTLALAVMAAGLPNLGIATAYERGDGVLKRLGVTPLPRGGLIAAKLLAVGLVELAQVLLLTGIAALAYGWRPTGAIALALAALLLGTAAFAGLRLLLAGTLRPEATLACANGLFLLLLLFGGLFVPLDVLPAWMVALGRLLPAAALAEALRAALRPTPALPPLDWGVLLAWGLLAPVAAARTFRWE